MRIGIYGPGARLIRTIVEMARDDAMVTTGRDYLAAAADLAGDEAPDVVLALGPDAEAITGAARSAGVLAYDMRTPEGEAALRAGLPEVPP